MTTVSIPREALGLAVNLLREHGPDAPKPDHGPQPAATGTPFEFLVHTEGEVPKGITLVNTAFEPNTRHHYAHVDAQHEINFLDPHVIDGLHENAVNLILKKDLAVPDAVYLHRSVQVLKSASVVHHRHRYMHVQGHRLFAFSYDLVAPPDAQVAVARRMAVVWANSYNDAMAQVLLWLASREDAASMAIYGFHEVTAPQSGVTAL